ncbi:hypothetical protein [Spiroplasma endosymbiont of Cantharis lateralis]|uniref:hypothetical protein n=1 Tax=Spiroplasma endosymbiont of Cantharis lateralis TaxID=3066277 RepID=UPI00313E833A
MELKPTLEINNSDEKEMIKSISISKSKINGSVVLNIVNSNSSPEEKIQALIQENMELREFILDLKVKINNEYTSYFYIRNYNKSVTLFDFLSEIANFETFKSLEVTETGYYKIYFYSKSEDKNKFFDNIKKWQIEFTHKNYD